VYASARSSGSSGFVAGRYQCHLDARNDSVHDAVAHYLPVTDESFFGLQQTSGVDVYPGTGLLGLADWVWLYRSDRFGLSRYGLGRFGLETFRSDSNYEILQTPYILTFSCK